MSRGAQIIAATGRHGLQAEARERIAEVAEILAAGLMRLMARKSSQISSESGESSLHLVAAESADPAPQGRRMPDAR